MQPAIAQLLRWHDDPVEFVSQLWPEAVTQDPKRWAWQSRLLREVAANDRISIRSGHGVGKTAFLVFNMLWWLLTRAPNALVLVTANSQDQLRDNNWAEARRWINKLPDPLKDAFEINADHIKLKGLDSCFATARTASKENPEALQGLHAENVMIQCDEASGIPDIVFEVGAGSLSTTGAKLLLTGNPTRNQGYFYDAFHSLSARFRTLKVSSEEVPSARGHIEDIIAKYGLESNAFRVRVLGEFPTTDDDAVIPLDLIEAAKVRKVEPIKTIMPVWGLDVARMGNCKTALVKRYGNWLPKSAVKTWSKRDTMEVAGLVMHEYEVCPVGERPAIINIDSVGLGAGVGDRLNELGLPVGLINVGETPSGRERFINLRAELYWRAREWLEQRNSKIESPELCAELTKPTYSFTSSGKIRIETKEQMQARAIPSPDIADAFVLTFAGADRRKEHDLYEKRPRMYWKTSSAWAA